MEYMILVAMVDLMNLQEMHHPFNKLMNKIVCQLATMYLSNTKP